MWQVISTKSWYKCVYDQKRRELLELTKKKTGGDRVHGYPKGIRIISLFSCCKDWAARLECLFR
jgi:hypothetical protein